jgi:hypothetical protein
MLCIYNKVDILFCLYRICVVDKDKDNNYIISENKLLKIERLVYSFLYLTCVDFYWLRYRFLETSRLYK